MSRIRSRALLLVALSSLTSLAIAETTAATSTTEPDSGPVASTTVIGDADEAATASTSPGPIGPAPLEEPLSAGTYASENFLTPLTYAVPDGGWLNFADDVGEYDLANPDIGGIWCLCVFRDVAAATLECAPNVANPDVGTTAEEIVGWMTEHPGLDTSEPTPVTVGGLDGLMIEISMNPSWTETCPEYNTDEPVAWAIVGTGPSFGVYWGVVATESHRQYVLDLHGGGNILISIAVCCEPAFSDLDSPGFRERVDAIAPIVDTFEFDVASSGPESASSVPAAPIGAIDQAFDLGDGRTLYLECAGDQSPTIVLEVGEGGNRAHMASLFDALAPKYRVCSYDRRNIGLSSSAPTPRSAEDVVADVDDLLREADVPGPYLLVGSSYGAFIVNAYASLHPDRVAAVLMINHPIRTDWFIPEAYPLMTADEQAADQLWADGTTNAEHMDSFSMTEAIRAAGPMTMPYTVLLSTEPYQCEQAGVCGEIYDVFAAQTRRLADESPSGRFRLIDGAHDLYVTNLEDVVEEIDLLAAQLN